ncbi:hypothetical protein OG239_02805 [Streptomyces sp. NBC_00868]|uniref:hypothetical protein n=1 Tax=unclassified Streptomyces TaxID=2593676 RepID=UPI00324FCDA7|nr:hypothetical protein OG239_02805 [Streptomyces sp. NBC_00868]
MNKRRVHALLAVPLHAYGEAVPGAPDRLDGAFAVRAATTRPTGARFNADTSSNTVLMVAYVKLVCSDRSAMTSR